MQRTANNLAAKLTWLLTVFLLTCFLVFDSYTWGKYAFLLASGLILLISVIADHGILYFKLGAFQYFMAAFTLYAFLSAAWAIAASDSLIMSRTLVRILICFSMVYLYYIRQSDISRLLSAVMWAGYIVAVYSILFYGLGTVLEATTGANTRLNNEYANVNSIDFACLNVNAVIAADNGFGRTLPEKRHINPIRGERIVRCIECVVRIFR